MSTSSIPWWLCHKKVQAFKIQEIRIIPGPPMSQGYNTAELIPEGIECLPVTVSSDYLHRHKPQVGGYYVLYVDGYESFSPADAFENGYTRIEQEAVTQHREK